MSRQTKKPAQQIATKVKNVNLLPNIFATDPNKKMIDSTLDVMTSKGQMLSFDETYGLRSASNKIDEFFVVESNEVRRESQSNNMLVMRNSADDYLGKVSYLDIDNYFNVKNSPIVDGTVLDKNVNVLDLPVNPYRITDYSLFYWLPNDLPACGIHLEEKTPGSGDAKFSIQRDLLGKTFVTLKDDVTGRELDLQNGMIIFFTGVLPSDESNFLSADQDEPVSYYVSGVGEFIALTPVTAFEKRIPNSYLKKRPWDKDDAYMDPPAVKWDSTEREGNRLVGWDGSRTVSSEPEYITQERVSGNSTHWETIDHWYHITTIRAVAKFLGVDVSQLVSASDRAKRPIITFYRGVRLYNWPNNIRAEVNALLPYTKDKYQNLFNINDITGYQLENGNRVVFEEDPKIYSILKPAGSTISFIPVAEADAGDGAIIVTNNKFLYHRLIYKNSRWQFAQNKTEPNQTPLFEFYNSNGISLETFNESDFEGGVILGFKEGDVYDPILRKYVDITRIDFDIDKKTASVSPNQIKFYTEVDSSWEYTDTDTGEGKTIQGPYGYLFFNFLTSFYQPRRGLDISKQIQDVIYKAESEQTWTETIDPPAECLTTIHVYFQPNGGLQFYTDVDGYGLIRLSSKKGYNRVELVLPLKSGSEVSVVCHNLPVNLTFYKTEIINNITTPVLLEEPYCSNNSIKDGVITLNLNESISLDGGSTYIENELAKDNTILYWNFSTTSTPSYKTAIVKPAAKWRFLQNVHVKDKTNPIYNEFEITINDEVLLDGLLSGKQEIKATPSLIKKVVDNDKITIDSVVSNPIQKTAPLSLTSNPLNKNLSTLNYYSLYQHAVNLKSNATNSRDYIEFESLLQSSLLGGGTLLKHSSPISRFAVMATNMPFDFGDLLIKQGKHYDTFLQKLKLELENVITNNDYTQLTSYDLLSLAIENIFVDDASIDKFWAHSNMIGWGEQLDNYREVEYNVVGSFNLTGEFEPISHRAGQGLLLQISHNGRFLVRRKDYNLITEGNEYVRIQFSSHMIGKVVNIRQWYSRYMSRIPVSLAKIGLSQSYRPEIYLDKTYSDASYFLIRHDGSRWYLQSGVDENNYPVDVVDQLLYEYELAVWASMEYDLIENDFREIIEARPGYFRPKETTFVRYHSDFVNETNNWLTENNLYNNTNDSYIDDNSFTAIYQLGSGDYAETTITGSWRLIYKYVFDTDRPHTHPWEMLGHTIKPLWWDTYYSWTDSVKRSALETALRTGRINSPADPAVINPAFARCNHKVVPENFPVDEAGDLLPPDNPVVNSWLEVIKLEETFTWAIGRFGPYEQVFASTHRGIAAMAKTYYLKAPVLYVNRCWVPGQQVKNRWGQYIDRTTGSWQGCKLEHNYHRSIVDGETVFTSGIESLYSEFCLLNNINFKSEVIDKFNNVVVNKEFLLQGFTNKDNVRIQSTSINTQKEILFVPEENYAVRTVKHYPSVEKFYSGMRIIFDGTNYSVYGFNNEAAYFRTYAADQKSSSMAITVGNVVVKEKTTYNKTVAFNTSYGTAFSNRFELYDFILGYGKYLEDQGFVFAEPEGGDIRNWQLCAKQFILWSNDFLAPGNYIDLNPAADTLIVRNLGAHLESLEGTATNPGQIVDRNNKPLFSKDIIVSRQGEGDNIEIRPKNPDRSIYGIKLTFSYYESVVHLDPTSVFGDVYFIPEQATSKRSFVVGGKKTSGWTGEYFIPGYVLSNNKLIPNFDSMAEQGRSLLDIESSVLDPVVRDAVKDQFGLSRNIELKQLFLQEDNEISFKNAITYNKGTVQVFNSLAPLTHGADSSVSVYEEYMVRTGEFGNTENINFYEFEFYLSDTQIDYHDYQVVKFIDQQEEKTNNRIVYIEDNSPRWVYKPLNKNLRFKTYSSSQNKLKTSGPVVTGDTDYQIARLDDIRQVFPAFKELLDIGHYNEVVSYKKYDRVRYNGKLYYAKTTVAPGTWGNNNDKFGEIDEPILPNIYVNNYDQPNPDLGNEGDSIFTPGTWQILQTMDLNIGIEETCPGPSDVSKARVSTTKPHGLKKGEYVVIVNCTSETTSVDGIWAVDSVEGNNKFFINTRIADTIKQGKIFTLKPVRFKNNNELALATGPNAEANGYSWKKKFNPLTNVLGDTNVVPEPTASGYDSAYPIAVVDDGLSQNKPEPTYDFGNYQVYNIAGNQKSLVKEESLPVDTREIEQLIIYDYDQNKTIIKLELYDPKKLILPEIFKSDIDVTSRVDPARYTRTTDDYKSVYASLGWYEEMVGKRWWDISTVNFSDYEYGDELTRAKFWGTTINNKPADVYEWTRSPVHPSQWATLVDSKTIVDGQLASGEAYVDKTLGENHYHWVEEEEYQSGNTYTIYYFWVKNKNTISVQSKAARVYTTKQLGAYILNPSAAGLAWWSPISNNAIVIKGIEPYLNNSGTVIQIKKKTKGGEKHHQWTFISDGNTVETIPEWIHVRFRDSISAHIFYRVIGPYKDFFSPNTYKQGDIVRYREDKKFYVCRIHMTGEAGAFDIYNEQTNPNGAWFELKDVFEVTGSLIGTWDGYFWDKIPWDYSLDKYWFWKVKNVPDPVNLHRYNKLGNSIRPYIQGWFDNVLEARRTFIKRLNEIMINVDIKSIPNWGLTRLNDTEYVIADETANITKYWRYVDFKSEDYDPSRAISTVLSNESDIYLAPISINDYVKINTGIKDYVIYEKNADQSFSVVYRTKGAIEFDKILYDPVSLSSWDTAGWEKYSWDFDLNSVYNAIVDALRNEIFVGKYNKYYSSIICSMFRYVLSEQINVDWLAKSSTIEPLNLIGKSLSASDTLKRDEITVLTNFYSTVKSYRDKVRGGTVNKNSSDEVLTEIDETVVIRDLTTGVENLIY
jgi:hypothetical protein